MTSVRLSSNVEVLCGVFWELLEEQSQESVNVLSSSDGVADASTGVAVADINGLIEEDDRCI